MLAQLPEHLGESAAYSIADAGPADAAGWVTASLCFDSFWSAREHILALGGAVEIVEPEALRRSASPERRGSCRSDPAALRRYQDHMTLLGSVI